MSTSLKRPIVRIPPELNAHRDILLRLKLTSVGDVSNVTFSNVWVARRNGEVLIYYGSSDTRMHVATSTIDKLVDYCLNTPEDNYRSAASVAVRNELISNNLKVLKKLKLR